MYLRVKLGKAIGVSLALESPQEFHFFLLLKTRGSEVRHALRASQLARVLTALS